MHTHESPDRLVMQPETDAEQAALNRLQSVFPNVVGGPTARFTLDVGEYDELDHDLAESAVFDPDRDRYDAGARALVVSRGGRE